MLQVLAREPRDDLEPLSAYHRASGEQVALYVVTCMPPSPRLLALNAVVAVSVKWLLDCITAFAILPPSQDN